MGSHLVTLLGLSGRVLRGWAAWHGGAPQVPGLPAVLNIALDGADGPLKGGGKLGLPPPLVHASQEAVA